MFYLKEQNDCEIRNGFSFYCFVQKKKRKQYVCLYKSKVKGRTMTFGL